MSRNFVKKSLFDELDISSEGMSSPNSVSYDVAYKIYEPLLPNLSHTVYHTNGFAVPYSPQKYVSPERISVRAAADDNTKLGVRSLEYYLQTSREANTYLTSFVLHLQNYLGGESAADFLRYSKASIEEIKKSIQSIRQQFSYNTCAGLIDDVFTKLKAAERPPTQHASTQTETRKSNEYELQSNYTELQNENKILQQTISQMQSELDLKSTQVEDLQLYVTQSQALDKQYRDSGCRPVNVFDACSNMQEPRFSMESNTTLQPSMRKNLQPQVPDCTQQIAAQNAEIYSLSAQIYKHLSTIAEKDAAAQRLTEQLQYLKYQLADTKAQCDDVQKIEVQNQYLKAQILLTQKQNYEQLQQLSRRNYFLEQKQQKYVQLKYLANEIQQQNASLTQICNEDEDKIAEARSRFKSALDALEVQMRKERVNNNFVRELWQIVKTNHVQCPELTNRIVSHLKTVNGYQSNIPYNESYRTQPPSESQLEKRRGSGKFLTLSYLDQVDYHSALEQSIRENKQLEKYLDIASDKLRQLKQSTLDNIQYAKVISEQRAYIQLLQSKLNRYEREK